METRYLDFDLSIERIGKNRYRSRVLASPAGVAKAEFIFPLSALEIENFILKIGRTRRMVRRIESPEMEVAKDFGSKLFKAVFSDDIQSVLRSSLDQARSQGLGLRLRLRMNEAPELADIPWEFLYITSLNRFLALSVNTPIVRYLELPESIQPLAVKPPLRVLVMIANPKDHPSLDVEREWRNLKTAVSDLEEAGLLTMKRLEAATPVALQYSLRREDYHIFHFIGHGKFDVAAQDGQLLLEDENGLGRPLSGQYLGTLLHDEDSLRLVVLNACEGARTDKKDPFAGTAQSLVQQGLPAVIAMQFEVTDEAAITFAHEFYAALADGLPVDAALSEARKVIFSKGNEIEWGTPVLYLRAPDGRIFDIVPTKQAPRTVQPPEAVPSISDSQTIRKVDPLYVDALGAYYTEDYAKAAALFQKVLAIYPNYQDAAEKLADANQKAEQRRMRAEIERTIQSKDWNGALTLLEQLARQLPDDQEVGRQHERVRKQVQLDSLYGNARKLVHSGQWQAAVKVFAQIRGVDPDYPDAEGLQAIAEDKLAEQTRLAETEVLYAEALKLINAGQWEPARQRLAKVQERLPYYRDSVRLMAVVESRMAATQAEKDEKEGNAVATQHPPQAGSSPQVEAAAQGVAVVGDESARTSVAEVQKEAVRLPAQAIPFWRSLAAVMPARSQTWLAVAVMALGSWLGGIIVFKYFLDWTGLYIEDYPLLLGALWGLLWGFGIIAGVSILGLRLTGKQWVGILLTWAVSQGVARWLDDGNTRQFVYDNAPIWIGLMLFMSNIIKALPGPLVLVYGLRQSKQSIPWKAAWLIAGGLWIKLVVWDAMSSGLIGLSSANPYLFFYLGNLLSDAVIGIWMVWVLSQAKVHQGIFSEASEPAPPQPAVKVSLPLKQTWLAAAAIVLGSWGGGIFVYKSIPRFFNISSNEYPVVLGALWGLLWGLGIIAGIRILDLRLTGRQWLGILLVWAASQGIDGLLSDSNIWSFIYQNAPAWASLVDFLHNILEALPGPLVLVYCLQLSRQEIPWKTGWMIAGGLWIVDVLLYALSIQLINQSPLSNFNHEYFLGHGLVDAALAIWIALVLSRARARQQP